MLENVSTEDDELVGNCIADDKADVNMSKEEIWSDVCSAEATVLYSELISGLLDAAKLTSEGLKKGSEVLLNGSDVDFARLELSSEKVEVIVSTIGGEDCDMAELDRVPSSDVLISREVLNGTEEVWDQLVLLHFTVEGSMEEDEMRVKRAEELVSTREEDCKKEEEINSEAATVLCCEAASEASASLLVIELELVSDELPYPSSLLEGRFINGNTLVAGIVDESELFNGRLDPSSDDQSLLELLGRVTNPEVGMFQ